MTRRDRQRIVRQSLDATLFAAVAIWMAAVSIMVFRGDAGRDAVIQRVERLHRLVGEVKRSQCRCREE